MASSSSAVVFSVQGLSKVYRSGEVEVVALHDVSLEVRRSEFIVLLGLLMLEGQMGLINGVLVRWSAVIDEQTLRFQDWLLTAFSN